MNIEDKIKLIINRTKDDWTDNANKDGTVFAVKRDLLAGELSKEYAKNILPKYVYEMHKRGDIHWHDLDYSPTVGMFNCMLIDFKNLLENGFRMGNADIEEPKSLQTACSLVAQIVANVSSNIYGGTSFHRADEVLERYAQKTWFKELDYALKFTKIPQEHIDFIKQNSKSPDYIGGFDSSEIYFAIELAKKQTEKKIYDAIQSLFYELNTLYNSNGQSPFFTINFGLGESWFAREIQKAILQVSYKGLGKSELTAVFPKLIFTLKAGLNKNKEDKNYDIKRMALKTAAKRIYPDILSYDKVIELYGDFVSPMGCRSFLPVWKNEEGKNVFYGRRNMGVVTLNLPRCALSIRKAFGNANLNFKLEQFYALLNYKLEELKKVLDYRISSLKDVYSYNAPILYMYGATGHRLKAKEKVSDIFKNGEATISLGWIGMFETMVALTDDSEWEQNEIYTGISLNILKYINDKTKEWEKENGYAYSVYATPSESLTDKFCRLDKEQFGLIENITDKEYYTNSFHYDVRKQPDFAEKILFEKEYIPYTLGGNICYVEMPNLAKNLDALESIWDFAYNQIPYFGVNTPIDKCLKCGYEGEFVVKNKSFECPECGNDDPLTTSCIRRLCGYLGSVTQRKPIGGRTEEIRNRKKHL